MGRAESAPLAPGFREEALWRAGVERTVVPAAELPRRADVVVVGAGYCGVSAGWELARRERHVVVLDAHELGWGASTRNGGMVIPELKYGPRALARRLGPLGRRLVDAAFDAFDLVEQLTAGADAIECDYERSGGLLLAHHGRAIAELRETERELVDDLGVEARVVTGVELAAEIGTDAYPAGLVMERTGGLHPARYHSGLVRAALDAGAELHPNTPAIGLERIGTRMRVQTTRGVIDASDVVLATNAYADDVMPWLRARVLPIGSFIVATVPLTPDVAHAVSPRGRMVFDTKNFLFYWRLSPDRRLVFGGRTSLADTTVERARDVLYRHLVRVHPQLAGVPLEYAWGGDVAITMDRLPHVGRSEGVTFATGCNGTGVALATWLGLRLGGWLAGAETAPPFAELPFGAVPLRRWRRGYLPLVGRWLRLRDRLGR